MYSLTAMAAIVKEDGDPELVDFIKRTTTTLTGSDTLLNETDMLHRFPSLIDRDGSTAKNTNRVDDWDVNTSGFPRTTVTRHGPPPTSGKGPFVRRRKRAKLVKELLRASDQLRFEFECVLDDVNEIHRRYRKELKILDDGLDSSSEEEEEEEEEED